MKDVGKALSLPPLVLALMACGQQNDAGPPGESASPKGGQVNNVLDCAQYPADGAEQMARDYLPKCREWVQSRGYSDAVVLPMETAAQQVQLASDPLTCPKVNPGNTGYYCIGLDKQQAK